MYFWGHIQKVIMRSQVCDQWSKLRCCWISSVGMKSHLSSHRFDSRRQHGLHTSAPCMRKTNPNISSEPYKFTASAANTRTLAEPAEKNETNEYQPVIVALSLIVFMVYFMYLREENDIDEALNMTLFERVPSVEEPHLAQAIPRMRDSGEDTTEAEARLKELIQQRQQREREASNINKEK